MDNWKAQVTADGDAIRALRASQTVPTDDYQSLTHEELETALVDMHALHRQAEAFSGRYHEELAADRENVEFIRANNHARFQK